MPFTRFSISPVPDARMSGRAAASPVTSSVTMLAAAGSSWGRAALMPSTRPVTSDVAAPISAVVFSTRKAATLVTMLAASAVSGSMLAVTASTMLCSSPMAAGRIASTSAGSASTTTATAVASASLTMPMFSLSSVSSRLMPSISAVAMLSPITRMSSGWKPSDRAVLMSFSASVAVWLMVLASGINSPSICRFTPPSASDRLLYLTSLICESASTAVSLVSVMPALMGSSTFISAATTSRKAFSATGPPSAISAAM